MTTKTLTTGRVEDAVFQAACKACRNYYAAAQPDPSAKGKRPKDVLRFLIALCIEEGANTEPGIRGAIHSLGVYNPAEVTMTLKREAGLDRTVSRWLARGDGTYELHPNAFD